MYVPSSGGIFVGRSLVPFQSHTKLNSTMERIAVVVRNSGTCQHDCFKFPKLFIPNRSLENLSFTLFEIYYDYGNN